MMHPDPADPPKLQLPPAAIPSGNGEGAVAARSTPDTVAVTFVSLEGTCVHLTFQRHTTLKAMQKQLCSAFGKNFPHAAAVLCVGAKAYSDFEDVPLLEAVNHETANVTFVRQLTDPSGYDQISRKRANRITLEEECTWEALVAKGETQLELEEWVFSPHRCIK